MKHIDMSTGIAWFDKDSYEEMKGVVLDPEVFAKPYDEWLALAESKLAGLREKGVEVRKVMVNVKSYCEWCDKNSRPKDSRSRADYAARVVKTGGLF